MHQRGLLVAGVVLLALSLPVAAQTYGGPIVPIPIPDDLGGCGPPSAGAPVSTSVFVPQTGFMTDVNITVGLTHTWYGDLVLSVTHRGITVFLMASDAPCGSGTNLGGVYTFDDEAAGTFDAAAVGAGPIPSGAYIGDAALAAFDGTDMDGTWTVTVYDEGGADVGTLDGFSVTVVKSNVLFDVQAGPACAPGIFPAPCGAPGDEEGVSWNGAGVPFGNDVTVGDGNGSGFPVGGCGRYLRVPANGPIPGAFACPGPVILPRPVPLAVNEACIPIPAGAPTLSFTWEFYNAEGAGSAFADGCDISIVTPGGGAVIIPIVYADVCTPLAGGVDGEPACVGGGASVAPPGPQFVFLPLPPLPPGAYLSCVCWNEGDNAVASVLCVDDVNFGSPKLELSAPLGPGSVRVKTIGGPPGSAYVTVISLNAGVFPGGWLFGVDPLLSELYAEIPLAAAGVAPFGGVSDGSGASCFTLPAGVPGGISVYCVTLFFAPGFGTLLGASPAILYET